MTETEIPSGPVKIIDKRYGMPLKLSIHVDSCHDRQAWGGDTSGDTNDQLYQWKFYKSTDQIDGDFYIIVNEKYKLPLKLSIHQDKDGDRAVWGAGEYVRNESNPDNSKEQNRAYHWKVFHVGKDKYPFYKIVNCEQRSYLKLSINKDGIGDRVAWGHHSDTDLDGDLFIWRIEEY